MKMRFDPSLRTYKSFFCLPIEQFVQDIEKPALCWFFNIY